MAEEAVLEAPPEMQSDAEADASLSDGFASEAPTAPDQEKPATPAPVADVPETPAPDAVVAEVPAEPVLAKITQESFDKLLAKATEVDQIKAALDQRFSGLGGKLGGLERTLRELQVSTPSGQALALSPDDFKELKDEFPELAELTLKGLTRAMGKLKGTAGPAGGVQPQELDQVVSQIVSERVKAIEEAREMRSLTRKQADWQEVVGAQNSATPYRQWLATQPDAYQKTINESVDHEEILESINLFKKEAAPKPKPTSERERQLRAAVPLKSAGGGSASSVEEDGFTEGFKKELAAST